MRREKTGYGRSSRKMNRRKKKLQKKMEMKTEEAETGY